MRPLFPIIVQKYDSLKLLLKLGFEVNATDAAKMTLLMHAAACYDSSLVVELLLQKGADVHLVDALGNTALHYVKESRNAYFLIKAGSSLTLRNNEGKTPQEYMGENTYVSLQYLVDFPLHAAIAVNDTKQISHLIKVGYRLDQEDSAHSQAIDYCDDEGKTLLMLAIPYPNIVTLLLNKGSNVSITDPEGNTALHFAVSLGQVESCRLLILEGASPQFRNKKGITPMKLAIGKPELEACFRI